MFCSFQAKYETKRTMQLSLQMFWSSKQACVCAVLCDLIDRQIIAHFQSVVMQNVRLGHYGYVGDGAEVETFSNCKNLLKQFYVIPMLFPHSGNLASLTYEARRNLAEKNQMILLIKFYLMKLCHFQMENGRYYFCVGS